VATKFKESANILADRLRNPPPGSGRPKLEVGVYTGDTHPDDRTKMEDEFQAGNIDVIVGTLAALKEGITLTAAHHMYCLTRDFVPSVNEQFESRCDRLGQQHQVMVYIPQAENTVSPQKVEPLLRLKERIVGAVLPKIDIEEEFA
jgi:SNF2 family DNA or RNA helicase